jgi:hypothetical protein
MNRIHSHLDEVNLIGKLAELKEDHYKNTLALTAIIELLVEKGILTTQEIQQKAAELDAPILDPTYPIS